MKKLFAIPLALFFTACATQQFHWEPTPTAKTNWYEAQTDCETKAAVAVGQQQGNYDWGFAGRRDNFMTRCLMGQGFQLVKNPEPPK